MILTHGQRYRATIRLGMFEQVATNEMIRKRLEDAGFVSIAISGSGRDRFAIGTWGGGIRDASMPEQITRVEVMT